MVPVLSFLCLAAVVVDGDTLRCANIADAGGRVRIARIDAPERSEPGGPAATAELARLIAGQRVSCTAIDADPRIAGYQPRDRFGRIVARCSAGGTNLGAAMIAGGHAGVWPKRKKGG